MLFPKIGADNWSGLTPRSLPASASGPGCGLGIRLGNRASPRASLSAFTNIEARRRENLRGSWGDNCGQPGTARPKFGVAWRRGPCMQVLTRVAIKPSPAILQTALRAFSSSIRIVVAYVPVAAGARFQAYLLTGEDGDADTTVPRLQGLGADLGRCYVLERREEDAGPPLSLPSRTGVLAAALAQTNARLLVIDPIMAFLDPPINTASDPAVRRALATLASLAERHGCCKRQAGYNVVTWRNDGKPQSVLVRRASDLHVGGTNLRRPDLDCWRNLVGPAIQRFPDIRSFLAVMHSCRRNNHCHCDVSGRTWITMTGNAMLGQYPIPHPKSCGVRPRDYQENTRRENTHRGALAKRKSTSTRDAVGARPNGPDCHAR